jgi:hypothetical protein
MIRATGGASPDGGRYIPVAAVAKREESSVGVRESISKSGACNVKEPSVKRGRGETVVALARNSSSWLGTGVLGAW